MKSAVPHIAEMAPYAVANLSVEDPLKLISMAQNESLRPPSPAAIDAARATLTLSAEYPNPDYPELRRMLSDTYEIEQDLILCGAGSMELITCIAQAYAASNRRVLSTQYGCALFRNSAEKVGAPYDVAPEVNFTVSVDDLLSHVQDQTAIVFVANPGNPTGTRIPLRELVRLRDELADNILLVIDEAYGEFSDGQDGPVTTLVSRGNTIVLRTLSKAYGLASGRIGWGVFPRHVGAEVRKLIIPSSISSTSAAMATAAIGDQAYMQSTCKLTAQLRDAFRKRVCGMGLTCVESHTNFLLIVFPSVERAQSADQALRKKGIVMRGMAGYGLPNCLRATVAHSDTMQLAGDVLQDWAEGVTQ